LFELIIPNGMTPFAGTSGAGIASLAGSPNSLVLDALGAH